MGKGNIIAQMGKIKIQDFKHKYYKMENFKQAIPHDTILKKISIDRTTPGESDTILFDLVMPNGLAWSLQFYDVYFAQFNLNFGVIAEETINRAFLEKNNELNQIIDKWQAIGANVIDLECFVITTNSTNSSIKIYAKSYTLNPIS